MSRPSDGAVKLFLGGLSWSLTEGRNLMYHSVFKAERSSHKQTVDALSTARAEQIKEYFESKFGPVKDVVSASPTLCFSISQCRL